MNIAKYYKIYDLPNIRSSHEMIVVRGAGIIFPLSFIIPIIYFQSVDFYLPLLIGVAAISLISFLDDIITLKNIYRIIVHFLSVALLLNQLDLFVNNPIYIIPVFVLIVGIINAYNFMDGINGIHVLYTFITFSTLFYISETRMHLIDHEIFLSIISSLFVFAFFNLRKNAKCFSGDIGSISIAFIVSYLIISLIINTEDFRWLLLLAIYGVDSVGTIILRLIRRENIFVAHRSHFYQHLANERKISHIVISFAYATIQFILNCVVLYGSTFTLFIVFILIVCIYILLRLKFEGAQKLFIKYSK